MAQDNNDDSVSVAGLFFEFFSSFFGFIVSALTFVLSVIAVLGIITIAKHGNFEFKFSYDSTMAPQTYAEGIYLDKKQAGR